MAGKQPAAAVRAFLEPLGAVVSCVTAAIPRASSYEPGGPHHLLVADGLPLLLRGSPLRLTVAMGYRVVRGDGERGPWRVTTTAYQYAVLGGDEGRELLAYHWRPEGREKRAVVADPHLHVRAEGAPGRLLRKAHLPTGRVALEDVVALRPRRAAAPPRLARRPRADPSRVHPLAHLELNARRPRMVAAPASAWCEPGYV